MNPAWIRATLPLVAAAVAAGCAGVGGTVDPAALQTGVGDRLGPGGRVVVRELQNHFHDDGGRVEFVVANEGAASLELLDVDVELGFPAPAAGFDAPYRPFHFDHVEWEDVAPGETRAGSVSLRGAGDRPLFSRLTMAPHGRTLVARADGWPGTCFLGWSVECVALQRDTTDRDPTVTITLENTDQTARPDAPPRALLYRVRFLRDGVPVPLPDSLVPWRPLPEPLGGARGSRCTFTVAGLADVPGISNAALVLQIRTVR